MQELKRWRSARGDPLSEGVTWSDVGDVSDAEVHASIAITAKCDGGTVHAPALSVNRNVITTKIGRSGEGRVFGRPPAAFLGHTAARRLGVAEVVRQKCWLCNICYQQLVITNSAEATNHIKSTTWLRRCYLSQLDEHLAWRSLKQAQSKTRYSAGVSKHFCLKTPVFIRLLLFC
ncbi:MAG: hypothetical protein ING66_15870 [Rhodocyclaceae bacterium]|nr:hypothetical protein [Rhodocyclaceae bacterium]MCA3059888.1 hypothetical protein [Rhodocyclaceae bacterium]MCA3081249.1 hypothetical protein [Rhodocyclaceae bacterium]